MQKMELSVDHSKEEKMDITKSTNNGTSSLLMDLEAMPAASLSINAIEDDPEIELLMSNFEIPHPETDSPIQPMDLDWGISQITLPNGESNSDMVMVMTSTQVPNNNNNNNSESKEQQK